MVLGRPADHDGAALNHRIRLWLRFSSGRCHGLAMKTAFHIGFNFLSVVILATVCGANDASVVRLASPEAAVGPPPNSCRPALTGEGGPVAWQVLLVQNRAALGEMSPVA